jgi:hypothetical protein
MLMTNIFETIVIVRITDAHYLKIQVAGFFTFFAKVRLEKNYQSKDFDFIFLHLILQKRKKELRNM